MRDLARRAFMALLVGALMIGVAWAGSGLVPIRSQKDQGANDDINSFVGVESATEGENAAASTTLAPLEPGQIYGGAAKVSLFPRPEDYQKDFPGARWEQDQSKCEPSSTNPADAADVRVRWAENPNCLYMGGYGLGPVNAITSWDNEFGLWTRSLAMSDGTDTVVITLIDAVYWEAHYDSMCPMNPCGFIDLANQLAEETGLKPESFVFASTHSHTSMDFIAGWGGVPRWYMQQATDSLKESARLALASLQPAVVEAGEAIVRERNAERRDFYRSAEDDGVSWFRLIDADGTGPAVDKASSKSWGQGVGNSPGAAIATVAAYPAHPVTEDEEGGEGDADFPAVFAKRVEEAFGGVGMFLQTGLGNTSPRGNKVEMGHGLASYIPAIGGGEQVTDTNVRVGRMFWDQPVTNVPLGHLGAAGVFDRTFNKTPAQISVGKSSFENKKCRSASHISVKTSVSAVKIGSLWITGGPGELFANLTNSIEERNPTGVTLALGLVNDGLGYIVQSFETDHVGRQGVGFVGDAEAGPVGAGLSEYEDAYSIDHCFGDAALEYTIQLLGQL